MLIQVPPGVPATLKSQGSRVNWLRHNSKLTISGVAIPYDRIVGQHISDRGLYYKMKRAVHDRIAEVHPGLAYEAMKQAAQWTNTARP